MAALSVNREDQARIKSLLTEAVTVLCRNGLSYSSHVAIDGLLGITVDDRDVFLVKLTENVSHSDSNADFSQVSELLGAAQNNFGLSLNADGSSPLPMHRFGGKDLNDNNCSTPAAINITPLGDGVLSAAARNGIKRARGPSSAHVGDQPIAKRPNMSTDSPLTTSTPTSATNSCGVGRIGEDAGGNLVIKSEPIDYDDETAAHQPYTGKTLGVISTVNTDNFNHDSADDSYHGEQQPTPTESQDGVLQALRAALIHKLANNGTPMTPKFNNNNNNESPSPTPGTTGGVKKRKGTPKNENQESEVTLKCLMCTYETNRRYNFIRHMRGHSKSYAIYACDLCGERFHSEDELGNHGLEAHKGHHLTCDQCGMTFMSERGKNIHAKTHKMMPIPEKKSVECETQCSQNDLEESMLNLSSGTKVLTSTGQSSDEAAASYRTLREQLSSRSLVIRFPVLNGRVQTAVVDGAMQEAGDQSKDEDDQPADLSLSKATSTTTPPPFTPKEESESPVAKTAAAMSSSAVTTKPPTATATKPPAATTIMSPAATTIKSPAATTIMSPAATTIKSLAATTIKSPAATMIKSPAATTIKSPAATTIKSPAATAIKSPAATTIKSPAPTATKPLALTVTKPLALTTTKAPAATTTKAPNVTILKHSTTAAESSPSTSRPTPHTTKVVSSAMNLSLPSSTIPCTTGTSRVLPTSALSTALANAVKAKSILISPPSASVSPTPSTSSATESESKTKSRKQHSAQIMRLVTVKKEPTED